MGKSRDDLYLNPMTVSRTREVNNTSKVKIVLVYRRGKVVGWQNVRKGRSWRSIRYLTAPRGVEKRTAAIIHFPPGFQRFIITPTLNFNPCHRLLSLYLSLSLSNSLLAFLF